MSNSISQKLRKTRLQKKISLDDVFVKTKISKFIIRKFELLDDNQIYLMPQSHLLKTYANFLNIQINNRVNQSHINKDMKNSGIAPEKIGSLIDLIVDEKISNRQAKEVFEEYMESSDDATIFIEKKGLVQLSDQSEIYNIIDKVLSDNPKMVDDYKNGKDKLFGFFIGQVMKISKGKANPKLVNELLVKRLKE